MGCQQFDGTLWHWDSCEEIWLKREGEVVGQQWRPGVSSLGRMESGQRGGWRTHVWSE